MERKMMPISLSALMETDSLGESSEDSDFRIEDCSDESNDEDDSADSDESQDKSDDNCKKNYVANASVTKVKLHKTPLQKQDCESIEFSRILICCVCLGDKSNGDNEIVECDKCGVTVHEDCYGVSDNQSVSSSGSGSSKMPWFCEACQAYKENPNCELCPNFGGIFKETDTGLWVHLVCALYIPGVAFRNVDKLSNVTLFEMSYSKWGKRVCSLCPDQQVAQTGVCIGCDAGLCRTYFHVTCAQKEGLLSEVQSEEMNHADPFYAHCKLHSDKVVTKIHKRNWLAFELKIADCKKQHSVEGCSNTSNNISMKNKLLNLQHKYAESKVYREQPWIPTQKMSRPLTSSASLLQALSRKAILSGIDIQALVTKEAHTNALAGVHRKWHISPAFNVEYMGYYLDRNNRISLLKQNLNLQMEENLKLIEEQRTLQTKYTQAMKDYHAEVALNQKLKSVEKMFMEILLKFNLSKNFAKTVDIMSENNTPASFVKNVNAQTPISDVNITIKNKKVSDNPEILCLKCVSCKMGFDQHLLVKCDTCQLYYHLSCLDPPLTRMPKKTKVMGWQCSECDKSSSDSGMEVVDTNSPRRLRQVKGNWKNFGSSVKMISNSKIETGKQNHLKNTAATSGYDAKDPSVVKQSPCGKKMNKKKERKRCRRNSTSINSNIKTIKQRFSSLNISNPECGQSEPVNKLRASLPDSLVEKTGKECVPNSISNSINTPDPSKPALKKHNISLSEVVCDTCKQTGTKANIVTCDECLKGFHFLCLSPPVKKSPKAPGYSWHCADCDPSESESD